MRAKFCGHRKREHGASVCGEVRSTLNKKASEGGNQRVGTSNMTANTRATGTEPVYRRIVLKLSG
ncbi:MAG: hypothetical protein WA185_04985, partial [Candidatus Acidiferrales bacterium]